MEKLWNLDLFNRYKEDEAKYTSKSEINLEQISDEEPWDANERVREIVDNFDKLTVELLTASSNLNLVNKKLRADGCVGLAVLGPVISRKSRPSLIVLACEDTLYAMDPDEPKLVKFLQMKLQDKTIRFWSSNGLEESDYLSKLLQLNLAEQNVQCCTAAHLHLMETMACMPQQARLLYPILAIQQSKRKFRIEKFEKMIEIWLDVDKSSIFFEREKLAHLDSRPLSLTAVNIILKRCILIRPLALALEEACLIELRSASREIFDRFQINKDNQAINDMLEGKKQSCQDKRLVDLGCYSYLELGRDGGTVLTETL